jgi:hypothetical protein
MNLAQAEAFSAPNSGQKVKGADSIAPYHGTVGPVQVAFPCAYPFFRPAILGDGKLNDARQ